MTATEYILANNNVPSSIEITGSAPFDYKSALQHSEQALLEGSVVGMNGIQHEQCKTDFAFLCQQTEKLAITRLMLRLHSVAAC